MRIDVRDNFPDIKRMLGDQQRQVPYATALALTRTAQDVHKAERAEMQWTFAKQMPKTSMR